MSNPIKNAIADFAIGQIAAPSVPTPTIDGPRMNIDYRQYPFAFASSGTSSSSVANNYYSDSSGGAYSGSLGVSSLDGSVEDLFGGAPRTLSGAMSTVGLGGVMGIGAGLSKLNLTNIEKNITEGKEGYALGMVDGKIVGVSPGPFGGYVLSGVLPSNLSSEQRKQLIDNLLGLQNVASNPAKDFAVSPKPTETPSDAELASTGSNYIVTDSAGRPVTTNGGNKSAPTTTKYVTTSEGENLSSDEINAIGGAMDAYADAADATVDAYGDMTESDFDFGYDVPSATDTSTDTSFADLYEDAGGTVTPVDDSDFNFDEAYEEAGGSFLNTGSDDSSNDDGGYTGTSYSIGAGAPVDAFNERPSTFTPDPSPPPSDDNNNDSGGGGGGCCFIMLEARYGDGTMDDVVRRYRDEHMTDRNKRGYYKVAEVLVPLMRKSRLAKWLVTKTFADPLVSYGKYYYGQNKHGVIFSPVKSFWMSVFNIVGGETEFIRENGKVV